VEAVHGVGIGCEDRKNALKPRFCIRRDVYRPPMEPQHSNAKGPVVTVQMKSWAANRLRPVAWGCVILLAVLSLLPAEEMVRTSLGGHIEHAIAYAGTAFLFGLSYPAWGWQRIAIALVIYAGILELLQNFSPGRHPAVLDWISSSAGALMGITFIRVGDAVWRRWRAHGWIDDA
jgi:VanZ family protein